MFKKQKCFDYVIMWYLCFLITKVNKCKRVYKKQTNQKKTWEFLWQSTSNINCSFCNTDIEITLTLMSRSVWLQLPIVHMCKSRISNSKKKEMSKYVFALPDLHAFSDSQYYTLANLLLTIYNNSIIEISAFISKSFHLYT